MSADRSETSTAFREEWNSAMRMPLTSLLIEGAESRGLGTMLVRARQSAQPVHAVRRALHPYLHINCFVIFVPSGVVGGAHVSAL